MTARTGFVGMWASILVAILFSVTAVFAAGAGAQETGCKGQVVVTPATGGRTQGR